MSTLRYQGEIDGLRAIAVTLVIFNHAKIELFSGGYVGVDIFFVISGYLITSIITRQIQQNNFSLLGFYKKRIRRIFPALFLVMLFCIPFAWKLMGQDEFREFSHSLNAVSFFVSNIFYSFQSGYFDLSADQRPLLHTWSLAIEEQFYIVFPILMLLVLRYFKTKLPLVFAIIFVVSLLISEVLSQSNPNFNFYSTFSRAWELMAGALLAVTLQRVQLANKLGMKACQVISFFGVACIMFAAFSFSDATRYPSFWTLFPVVGAVCIIGCAQPGTYVGRVFSSTPLVAIGLISYSLYLWHQPVFVFARLYSFDTLNLWHYLGLIGVIVLLSWLSWRFVEQPFRQKQRVAFFHPVAGITVMFLMVSIFGLGSQVFGFDQFEKRFGFTAEQLKVVRPERGNNDVDKCHWKYPVPGDNRIRTCIFGKPDTGRNVMLVGDSHADSLFAALNERLIKANRTGILLVNKHCRKIPGIFREKHRSLKRADQCRNSFNIVKKYIKSQNPQLVVVSMRWTFRLFPIPGKIEHLDFNNGEGGIGDETYREYYAQNPKGEFVVDATAKTQALTRFLSLLAESVSKLIVVYPIPEVGWSAPKLNFQAFTQHNKSASVISTDHALFLRRNDFIINVLDGLQEQLKFVAVRPSDKFCNMQIPNRCVAQFNGVPLYFDDNHLNNLGADIVVSQILDAYDPELLK